MDETVLEKVSENGIVTVIDHGHNRILSRQTWTLSPQYEFVHPVMEVSAGADVEVCQSITSQVYPFIFSQSLVETSAYLGLVFHVGRFDFGAKGTYGRGWLSEDEKILDTDTGILTSPFRLIDWYDRQMDYRTASRFRSELMARYDFDRGVYLRLNMSSVKGWVHPRMLPGEREFVTDFDRYRLEAVFAVGLDF